VLVLVLVPLFLCFLLLVTYGLWLLFVFLLFLHLGYPFFVFCFCFYEISIDVFFARFLLTGSVLPALPVCSFSPKGCRLGNGEMAIMMGAVDALHGETREEKQRAIESPGEGSLIGGNKENVDGVAC